QDPDPATRLDGMRVLVVARSSAKPAEIRESLESLGCSTDEMSGAAWLLPELRLAAQSGAPFHAVLLDLDIPDVDTSIGLEIEADPVVFSTLLIAMSANARREDDARLRERGFCACLPKPVSRAQLQRILASVGRPPEQPEAAAPAAVAISEPED